MDQKFGLLIFPGYLKTHQFNGLSVPLKVAAILNEHKRAAAKYTQITASNYKI